MSSSVQAITVESSDGGEFKMTVGAAIQSKLLNRMIEDVSVSADCKVRVSEVNSETLKKVIEYCEKHASMANDGASHSNAEELEGWDTEFMKVNAGDMLFHILMAANYLEVEGLFNLACQTVANSMKGKTPKEIRMMFNIKNDFTPEEQERLRRQNPSCSFD
ncbi:hypothetical protein QN277_024595 [Acacia crassicarpa]|uniref:SKP1-like protein n=1 Tax=Acacia crassicarpa TaxID=499986 RepID=A0AAE1JH11_9FABA|nr:hypothetical protein QN277_024595 [Acacia crassicarpa]